MSGRAGSGAPANVPEVAVNAADIEKSLGELWRKEKLDAEGAVTRAALWNVVAHTDNAKHHAFAGETLARVSGTVPQRTIVIRADARDANHMASWISANCHRVGGDKQVCSEEIVITAGGERTGRVPPLVNALLIPDMPAAVWWLGDLPTDHEGYVQALLEPADRIIVDSTDFDSASDLELVASLAENTTTEAADLNWVRLEEWRKATASLFDPEAMRGSMRAVRRLRVTSAAGESPYFGHCIEALLYAGWLSAQLGHRVEGERVTSRDGTAVEYRFEQQQGDGAVGAVTKAELTFDDGTTATVSRDGNRCVLKATVDAVQLPDMVTRTLGRSIDELIVRQLKRHDRDPIFRRVIPVATKLARFLRP